MTRQRISLLWFGFLLATSVRAGSAATTPEGSQGDKAAAANELFNNPKVLRIQILIPPLGIDALRRTSWGNGQQRPTVKATVREGGAVFTNVEVHLKGAAGSFRPVDDNPCLTLNFEKSAAGQTFHGLRKLSLNNSVQDPSFLSEKICRELFDAAGVPVPRAAHAVVVLNNRNLGLRVLTEGFDKQFLKRYFKNAKGNLYDGGFLQDITGRLSVNSGDNPQDQSRVKALIAASERNPSDRMAQLEQVLDMDRFLSFMAMDIIQCDWDGYAMNKNNWRLFHDLDANKLIFIPHGLDQMFGVDRTSPQCSITPRLEGMVARAVLGTTEGRRRYLERVGQLYTNVFHVDALLQRVDELNAVIHPAIVEATPQRALYHDRAVEYLKVRIAQRNESLKRQLTPEAASLKFETNGAARLTSWAPKIQTGAPQFRQEQGPDGSAALYIAAVGGNTIGSWRTKVQLIPGIYRFEGRIRTKDVRPGSGDATPGAGLRLSGGASSSALSGNTDWQNFAYPFQVTEGETTVELVCELRAAKGEAWFDRGSLRIMRLR